MRKTAVQLLAAITISTLSLQVMAYGGGSGGRGGSPSLTKEQLEQHWNGKAGEQSIMSSTFFQSKCHLSLAA